MKVLVDTNVWLDLILHRTPFEEDSKGCLMACVEESVDLCVAATSLKDIFYIASKCLDTSRAYEAVRLVLEISNAASVDDLVCRKKALELEKPDYEDGIIAAAAFRRQSRRHHQQGCQRVFDIACVTLHPNRSSSSILVTRDGASKPVGGCDSSRQARRIAPGKRAPARELWCLPPW